MDAGELYIRRGWLRWPRSSAFNGEARWVSAIRGCSWAIWLTKPVFFDMSARMFRTFRVDRCRRCCGAVGDCRAADGNGVMAFDRRDGSIVWQRELVGCRYVAGIFVEIFWRATMA